MKASYGVVFQEGKNHYDQGEAYNIGLNKEEGADNESIRQTLQEYQEKHSHSVAMQRQIISNRMKTGEIAKRDLMSEDAVNQSQNQT